MVFLFFLKDQKKGNLFKNCLAKDVIFLTDYIFVCVI